jgi:hypothetical protein
MKTALRIGTLHATRMSTDEATSGFHLNWPVDVHFGRGALGQLPTAMATRPERRILVLTSPSFAACSDLLDTIAGRLRDRETLVFDLVGSHPDIAQIQTAIDFARTRQVEAVIGLGGGSVLDTAKAVALLTGAGCDLRSYLLEEPDPAPAPLFTILIPTTAGSGSEVTPWATIWDTDNKRKHSLVLPSVPPRVAIVDPELTLTLPPRQTAISGADALAHALEAYWSRNVNPASEALAVAAIHRINEHLIGAYQHPMDLEHRTEMLLASLLAGLAFSQTKTAAAHAISYPLTSHFGIPHGQATGVSLPLLLGFNAEVAPKRFAPLCRVLGAATVPEAQDRFRGLLERVGLKTRLRDLGVPPYDVPMLAAAALTSDRLPNNARTVGPAEMERLLTELW